MFSLYYKKKIELVFFGLFDGELETSNFRFEEARSAITPPPWFPPRKHTTRENRASKIRGRTGYHV